MPKTAAETTLRYITLLQMIPTKPKGISTAELRDKLLGDRPEYKVNIRTIQRDLIKLVELFPLDCTQHGRAQRWFFRPNAKLIQIPHMGAATALAFQLTADYLTPVMPQVTQDFLAPYFQKAATVLQTTRLGKWSDKIRIIKRGPMLTPPGIQPQVQNAVYEALLNDKKCAVDYQSKGKKSVQQLTLTPLGIVMKDGIIYLVASAWDYPEPRQYAMHRMRTAEMLDEDAQPSADFDLAQYVEQEHGFSYPASDKNIKLRALFYGGAAFHLTELKLSAEQKITPQKDAAALLTATIADTAELRWWLLGFGSQVKVLGPPELRKEFAALTAEMMARYQA